MCAMAAPANLICVRAIHHQDSLRRDVRESSALVDRAKIAGAGDPRAEMSGNARSGGGLPSNRRAVQYVVHGIPTQPHKTCPEDNNPKSLFKMHS